ncbi:MAG: FAD-dependent oxidoreductase [Pirellulaceae bacterium]|nr:FAD-dependent oxidoreductase [Pirellulaceae bacterium]
MRSIREPARDIPIVASTHVVICGGGPAGFVAALAAARTGANTVLIERCGFLGGAATAGFVGPISNFNCRGERVIGGIPVEFVEELARRGGAIIDHPGGNVPFDPEVYKRVAMEMIRNAGIRVLLHSQVVACVVDERVPGRVTHVVIENKSGRQAIETRFVVDCTGDADVVARAGLPCHVEDVPQPMSLCFRLGGVDTGKLPSLYIPADGNGDYHKGLREAMQRLRAAGEFPAFGGPWVVHGSTLREGEVSVNATRFSGSGIDAEQLTEAEFVTRENMWRIVEFMRQQPGEFHDCYLIDSAYHVGVRDSRRIDGLYTMTKDDVLAPRLFPDTVARGSHPIDIHSARDDVQHLTWLDQSYGIPFRSLVPVGSDNVLVAGRTASATREAFASMRVQATCMALGQAAGTAAALCNRECVSVESLDAGLLRETLVGAGAII